MGIAIRIAGHLTRSMQANAKPLVPAQSGPRRTRAFSADVIMVKAANMSCATAKRPVSVMSYTLYNAYDISQSEGADSSLKPTSTSF